MFISRAHPYSAVWELMSKCRIPATRGPTATRGLTARQPARGIIIIYYIDTSTDMFSSFAFGAFAIKVYRILSPNFACDFSPNVSLSQVSTDASACFFDLAF